MGQCSTSIKAYDFKKINSEISNIKRRVCYLESTNTPLPTFFPGSVIFADVDGNFTDDGPVFTFDTTTAHLNVYGIRIGRGSANEAESLVIGSNTGANLTSGALANTFIGFNSGNGITQGDYNVAIGWKAMRSGSVGFVENTVAIGQQALAVMSNASGRQVAIGAAAASAGGIPINGLYRTGSAVKIRVA